MSGFSEYTASGILNFYFNGQALSVPDNIVLALTSGLCVDTQNGATIPEVPSGINGSGTGYARVTVNNPSVLQHFWTYNSGEVTNSGNITFNPCLVDWGVVSGVAVLDNAIYGSGNLLFHGAIKHKRDVYKGDVIKYDAGECDICLE